MPVYLHPGVYEQGLVNRPLGVARTVTGTAASTGAIAGKVSFTAVNVGTWAALAS